MEHERDAAVVAAANSYEVRDMDGRVLARVAHAEQAHRKMRTMPDAASWHLPSGVTGGTRIRKRSYVPRLRDENACRVGRDRVLSPEWGGLVA